MKFNILGNTGIKISRLGLGTWALGGKTPGKTSYGNISKKKSLDIISKSFDLGINFFDTSPAYGFSEEILGNCFKNKRDSQYLIITVVCSILTNNEKFGSIGKPIIKWIKKLSIM